MTEKERSREQLAADIARWREHARAFDLDALTARFICGTWLLSFEIKELEGGWVWFVSARVRWNQSLYVHEWFPSIGAALAHFEFRLTPEQDDVEVLEEVG